MIPPHQPLSECPGGLGHARFWNPLDRCDESFDVLASFQPLVTECRAQLAERLDRDPKRRGVAFESREGPVGVGLRSPVPVGGDQPSLTLLVVELEPEARRVVERGC